jgi:hypothetical protein
MRQAGYHAYALEEDRAEGYLNPEPRPARPLRRLARRTDVLFTRTAADSL